MRNILLALILSLIGCVQSPSPTTERVWYVSIETTEPIDGLALLAYLDGYWAEFGVSFEFGEGFPSVSIQDGDPESPVAGHCGTGTSCVVYVAPIVERYGTADLATHLAVVVSHEVGHSYGLKHPQEDSRFSIPYDGCDIMNTEYYGICTSHYWNDIHRMDLLNLLSGVE